MSTPIRPNVLRMKPYPPGKPIEEVQRELGLSSVVKLASNENPRGPSPLAIQAIKEAASGVNIYPDAQGWHLKEKIAAMHGVDSNQVMLGAGSDEIIGLLGSIFLEPGTEMVIGDPSFIRYDSVAHLSGATLIKVGLTPDWRHDLPAIQLAITDATRLVFIANPNNPTGTVVTKSELNSFLDNVPDHLTVVLDEAYFEFASFDPDYPNGVDLVKSGRQVISLRTFSKAYGLAGLRVGYGIADIRTVEAYNSVRPPFDINSIALSAALAALDDVDHLHKGVRSNAEVRATLMGRMSELGFETIPSHTNFVCINVRQPSFPIYDALMREGVIVRPGEPLGMPTFLRVSIGTAEEIEKFIKAFESVMLASATN